MALKYECALEKLSIIQQMCSILLFKIKSNNYTTLNKVSIGNVKKVLIDFPSLKKYELCNDYAIIIYIQL